VVAVIHALSILVVKLFAQAFTSPGLDALRSGWVRSSLPAQVQDRLDAVMEGMSYEEVRERFDRYGLLDDQVQFLKGWFRDTLPSAPIERLALLRLDGDLYDSTYDALDALYPRLSTGGYAIVDDYNTFDECRRAVHDYLGRTGAGADIQPIDDEAVFWQKCD
jgi:Macrocin-O-methyltransferase (TylF)